MFLLGIFILEEGEYVQNPETSEKVTVVSLNCLLFNLKIHECLEQFTGLNVT